MSCLLINWWSNIPGLIFHNMDLASFQCLAVHHRPRKQEERNVGTVPQWCVDFVRRVHCFFLSVKLFDELVRQDRNQERKDKETEILSGLFFLGEAFPCQHFLSYSKINFSYPNSTLTQSIWETRFLISSTHYALFPKFH